MNQAPEILQNRESGVIRRLILTCLAQAVVVFLAGLNLELNCMKACVGSIEFVRWREMFSLLVILPATIVITFNIMWILEQGRQDARWPITLFMVSVCLLGISMGVHEPINAMPHADLRLAPAMGFWDELFSHAVFYMAYIGGSISLLWSQARNPLSEAMDSKNTAVFAGIAVLAGAGIFLTLLSGGSILVDLVIMVAMLTFAEFVRKGKPFRYLPIAVAMEGAYLLALVGLAVQRFCL